MNILSEIKYIDNYFIKENDGFFYKIKTELTEGKKIKHFEKNNKNVHSLVHCFKYIKDNKFNEHYKSRLGKSQLAELEKYYIYFGGQFQFELRNKPKYLDNSNNYFLLDEDLIKNIFSTISNKKFKGIGFFSIDVDINIWLVQDVY